jgi:hypothetical protein
MKRLRFRFYPHTFLVQTTRVVPDRATYTIDARADRILRPTGFYTTAWHHLYVT